MQDLVELDATALRTLQRDDLHANIALLKREQFNLRFQQATGQLEKVSRIRQVRHAIARHLTVIKEISPTPNGPPPRGGIDGEMKQVPAGTAKKSSRKRKHRSSSAGTHHVQEGLAQDYFKDRAAGSMGFASDASNPSNPATALALRLRPELERHVEANLAGIMQNALAALTATTRSRQSRLSAADDLHRSLARAYGMSEQSYEPDFAETVDRLGADIVDLVLDDDSVVGRAAALVFTSLTLGPDPDIDAALPSAAQWTPAVDSKVRAALATLVRDHPIQLLTEFRVEDAQRKRGSGLHVEVVVRVLDHFPFQIGGAYVPVSAPEWATAARLPLRVDAEIEGIEGNTDETEIDIEPVRVNGELAACMVSFDTTAPSNAELVLRPSLSGHRLATRRYSLGDLEELAHPAARRA